MGTTSNLVPLIKGEEMKVRAIGEVGVVIGYYNNKRVRGGEVFVIKDEKEFSEKWMEKVDDNAKSEKKKVEKREPVPLTEGRKAIHTGKIDEPKKEEKTTPEPASGTPEPKPELSKEPTSEQDVI